MVGQEETAISGVGLNESSGNIIYTNSYVTNGLRPVFTLKGDLKIVSGDGKSEGTAYRFN